MPSQPPQQQQTRAARRPPNSDGGRPLRRPVIGVTGPDRGGLAAWIFLWLAVTLAGGLAVHITPRNPRRIGGLSGLIIGGGADVDPTLYGQEQFRDLLPDRREKHPSQPWWRYPLALVLFPLIWLFRKLVGHFASAHQDPARDALELRLIRQALDRGLPVFGICRGEQLLNVYFGGSLHQDLKTFYVEDPETRTILPRKVVSLSPGTRLCDLLGPQRRVNALHHQGIDRLGRCLRVAAVDRNGIVQAVEHESLPFVLGVQWHPEFMPQHRRQRALFKALVDEARRVAEARLSAREDGGGGPGANGRGGGTCSHAGPAYVGAPGLRVELAKPA